jgi:NADH-quinone oxidoreductase subunit J
VELTQEQVALGVGTLLGAVGMWLLLPRGNASGRAIGLVLTLISAGMWLSQAVLMGPLDDIVYWSLASITLVSAVATVTFRNPVYCALWFALSLMGTAGLLLVLGAQFLGVATIVVYAGAILVTFLFVLMLAQPRGQAFYDRLSWEGPLSAATGAVMVGILTMTVLSYTKAQTAVPTAAQLADNVLAAQHTAHLGGQLFSKHLISVEVAGTLLLVALVGAVAIVAHGRGGLDARLVEDRNG